MTKEEKAKAYDEALERAKNFIENGDEGEKTVAESIFAGLIDSESEGERIRKELIELMKQMSNTIVENYTTIKISTFITWLEKQGERKEIDYNEELEKCKANPLYFFDKYVKVKLKEQKPAWSEGDYKKINYLICLLQNSTPALRAKSEELINWLKSLRPQNTWKPSDGQIQALEFVIDYHAFANPENRTKIKTLYNDLKKLM